MNIAHVFAPGRVGGLEQVVEMLAVGQVAAGHQVSSFSILPINVAPPAILQRLCGAGVDVRQLPVTGRAYISERRAFGMALAPMPRTTVIHSHGYRADVLYGAVARAMGFATVTTLHGFTGGDVKNRAYEALQRRAVRSCRRIVVVSRPLLDRMRATGVSPHRLCLIPNAYASRIRIATRAEARAALGLSDAGLVVGWVGRLSYEKGPDILIDAVATMHAPFTTAIVGEGPELPALERSVVRHGLASRVRWTGAIDNVAQFFLAFDVLVASSRTEGTPIVLLEAMAAGVPIVAVAVGGIPDMLSEQEARLVPAESPSLLAAAIAHALRRDPDTAKRVEYAKARLSNQFAIVPWLSAYERVYREAMEEHLA